MSIDSRFVTHRIAEAIADETPVDWSPAERALGSEAQALEGLRLIDDVARALRSLHEQAPARADSHALFRWGTLEVNESLGAGQTGEVFRAFDTVLQRDVALKLRAQRDPLTDPGNAQLLGEARQLARIRHRNVLAVYGAAVHEGRAGIWSELIDGRTLKEIVASEGAFAAEEALRIGLDVARALGVVHGVGLVHGDVKAENVMRERGGRIVLMDFGASGRHDELAARLSVSGTRRYLAPEILEGATPDLRSDLYALAVLLHFLLRGEYPLADDGSLIALAQRRPDLSASLCMQLDALLAHDPAQRPQDAAAFAKLLLVHLPERSDGTGSVMSRPWLFATAAMFAALALGLGWNFTRAPSWRFEARFVDPVSQATIVDGTPVDLGDALSLRLHASHPTHVYVFNEDADRELNVLFPLPGLEQQNPLAGDRDHRLPGTVDGRELAWEIASVAASESFVLIASADPLPELARHVAKMQAAKIDIGGQRGASRLRALSTHDHLQATSLAALVDLAKKDQADPSRLLVMDLRLPHAVP
jgi:hypothetical protein